MMLTPKDLTQIKERGSDAEKILEQIEQFRTGFPYAELISPATISNGIYSFTDEQKQMVASYFDQNRSRYDICRFVPASGAATRMFKALFSLSELLRDKSAEEQQRIVRSDREAVLFFDSLGKYPFYNDLHLAGSETPCEIIDRILLEDGLNYGMLPKGLLKFHKYEDGSRTAFEEHLHEAARMSGEGEVVKLHFTVSEEHLSGFTKIEKEVLIDLMEKYRVFFEITYSFQKAETDTIAVDRNNNPFRDENGKLVFRPGGHGALLENLNDLPNEIVFINNIDNVSPDSNSELRILNKKMLAGLLLRVKDEAALLLSRLTDEPDNDSITDAEKWLNAIVNSEIPLQYSEWNNERKIKWLISKIERPIRVCGMVKNEGEPGGGPFFVKNSRGEISLQIVETSQIDLKNEHQAGLLKQSSHFNPVDLVCSLRNGEGKPYDLTKYVDKNAGFISEKSIKGRDLKALELPGLWNGSMAEWITLFVEIPAETFTPVKTIFDLVRPAHLS